MSGRGISGSALRLGTKRGRVRLFGLLGCDSESETEFIRHVGLAARSAKCAAGEKLVCEITDMQPPLRGRSNPGATEAQVVASVRLTRNERRRIALFVDELDHEYLQLQSTKQAQYTVHPHFEDRRDEMSCRRYSCAGFVLEAYRDAGIDLVDTQEEHLPRVYLKSLINAYPDQRAVLSHSRMRSMAGLKGPEPWHVLLPGHLFNSIANKGTDPRKTPYQAVEGDEYFPSRSERAASM